MTIVTQNSGGSWRRSWSILGTFAAYFKIKVTKPCVAITRVFKGKNVHFGSRDELVIFIHLPHLGVRNHRKLHNFVLRDTFPLEVNRERDSLLSFKVTGKVLEFLGIRSTTQLGHGRKSASLPIRVLANPKLRTEESPVFVSHKCDFQLLSNNLDTDFSGLHGLHVPTRHNGVASRRHSRMKIHLCGSIADFGTGLVVDFAVTRNGKVEPPHPRLGIADGMLIRECLDLGAKEWLAIGSNLCHFDKCNHGEVFDSLTRGTEVSLKVCWEGPLCDSGMVAKEVLKGIEIDRAIAAQTRDRGDVFPEPELVGHKKVFGLRLKGGDQLGDHLGGVFLIGGLHDLDTHGGNCDSVIPFAHQSMAQRSRVVRGDHAHGRGAFEGFGLCRSVRDFFHSQGMRLDVFGKGGHAQGHRYDRHQTDPKKTLWSWHHHHHVVVVVVVVVF
jgi:hypothetical protein